MIERTYRCDLCRDQHPLEKLIPIRWGSDNHCSVAEPVYGQSERHLCRRCIADIKAMPADKI